MDGAVPAEEICQRSILCWNEVISQTSPPLERAKDVIKSSGPGPEGPLFFFPSQRRVYFLLVSAHSMTEKISVEGRKQVEQLYAGPAN